MSKSAAHDSFFELIDIEGKDDVMDEMEIQVEKQVNTSIDFIL